MDFSYLKKLLNDLAGDMLPGCAARVSVGGKNVYEYHTGFSDEENEIPLDGGEIYSAYSMTKPITACCAMMAIEEGLMALDSPLYEYLPEFRRMKLITRDANGTRISICEKDILIRHLLNMSAGFGDDIKKLKPAPTREAICSLSREPLLFEPGTRWLYGLCYDVLGAALETVYGKTLGDIFTEKVFLPLGMKRSFFLSDATDLSLISPVYRAVNGTYEGAPLDMTYVIHPKYQSGGAGLCFSADDYERFLNALTTGALIGKNSFELMLRDALTPEMRRDFNWPQTKGYGYGFGLRVPLNESGYTDCGWGGAAGAYFIIDPSKDANMCFFASVLNADETKLHSNLRRAFNRCFLG